MPDDAQAALRLWNEANSLILSLLSDVVSGRKRAKKEAADDHLGHLDRLSRRLDRHLTALFDELNIGRDPPPLHVCCGMRDGEPLLWPLSPLWESPWSVVRQSLDLGADGQELLRQQQQYAEQGRRWLETIVQQTAQVRNESEARALDYEGELVLDVLARASRRRFTIRAIWTALKRQVSEKTIARRLDVLISDGLAERAQGPKRGAAVTTRGTALYREIQKTSS